MQYLKRNDKNIGRKMEREREKEREIKNKEHKSY